MNTRYNKILCVIIAMFIFVSGMCLEIPRADSSFVYNNSYFAASSAGSSVKPISQYEISGRENLGFRNAAIISSTPKRPVLRTVLRIPFLFYLVESVLLRTSDLQRAVETIQSPETHYATALLYYIHQQDGKK